MALTGKKGLLYGKMTVGSMAEDLRWNNSFDLLIDTGSSWSWVNSCDRDKDAYWRDSNHTCPYFKQWESSTLEAVETAEDEGEPMKSSTASHGKLDVKKGITGKKGIATKTVEYGGGGMQIHGPIYEDFLQPTGAPDEEYKAKLPLIMN